MPSRTINALERGELQRGLRLVTKDVEKLTYSISQADDEPVARCAAVLLKEVKRLIGTKGGGKPSAPGSPPNKQTGRLSRSWKSRVVLGGRRVGSGLFTASISEYGSANEAPRPYARAALENVAGKMGEVIVTESQRAVEKAP